MLWGRWGSCEQKRANVSRTKPVGFWQLLLLVLQPSQCSLHGPWGERGCTSVGRVSENFNNRQFQFVRAFERVVVDWLVLGSWKHVGIKELLGSSYFKRHKDPPSSGYQEGTCSFKAVNWVFAILGGGGGNYGYVSASGICFLGEPWLWTTLIPGEGLVRFLIPAQHWFLGW